MRGKGRNTGPTPAVRQTVYKRANWCCEKCGRSALHGADIHHRKPRRMGGTSDPAINLPSNLVLLCRDCHSHVESYRFLAIGMGWLVSSELDPAKIPIYTKGFGSVYLTVDGSYRLEGESDERDTGHSGDEATEHDASGRPAGGT